MVNRLGLGAGGEYSTSGGSPFLRGLEPHWTPPNRTKVPAAHAFVPLTLRRPLGSILPGLLHSPDRRPRRARDGLRLSRLVRRRSCDCAAERLRSAPAPSPSCCLEGRCLRARSWPRRRPWSSIPVTR